MTAPTDFRAQIAAPVLPLFAAKADSEADESTPEGLDCTCYFERDWVGYGFPKECESVLIGMHVFHDDGSVTAMTRDEAYDAFGVNWVRAVEWSDAERAECE